MPIELRPWYRKPELMLLVVVTGCILVVGWQVRGLHQNLAQKIDQVADIATQRKEVSEEWARLQSRAARLEDQAEVSFRERHALMDDVVRSKAQLDEMRQLVAEMRKTMEHADAEHADLRDRIERAEKAHATEKPRGPQ